jgi:hypothetical protein
MKKLNKVSIFTGKFDSEKDFIEIVKEIFDKDGNSSSIFMKNFEINFINPDLQESAFLGKELTKNDLIEASYAETFLDKIDKKVLIGNSIIILYDFAYSGKIKNKDGLNFIGVYDYIK